MNFTHNEPLALLTCSTCKSTGYVGFRVCSDCKGMSMGRNREDYFDYFGEPLTRYHIRLRIARRFLDKFRILGAVLFAVGFWALFFWFVHANVLWERIVDVDFWVQDVMVSKSFFWLGIIAFSYLWYRLIRMGEPQPEITYKKATFGVQAPPPRMDQGTPVSWKEVRRLSRRKRVDIADTLTENARIVLEGAFNIADQSHHQEITPLHVLYSLFNSDDVKGIFIRMGIPVSKLQARVAHMFEKGECTHQPVLSSDVQQILFHASIQARLHKDPYIRTTSILVATVQQSEPIQELLYDLNIDSQKLANVVEWVRIRERLRDQYRKFRRAAAGISKHGMDRAMTAVATPFLNAYSDDLTLAAKFGRLDTCVARDKEIDEIFRVIEAGRQNVILVGDHGVGKMTIIDGIVERMIEGNVPGRMKDKRFVQLSTSSLLAGTTVSGAQERLMRMMHEVARARNIILFINNIHDLIGMSEAEGKGFDVAESLSEFLSSGRFIMFATTLPDEYKKYIVQTEIGKLFSKIPVAEMDENQTIQVLESKVGIAEYRHNVFFSYDALQRCARLAGKFFYDHRLPDSAVTLMNEVASHVRSTRGEHQLVMPDDVGFIVSEKTGIPAASVSEDETHKLLRLEEEMHKRVIGQDQAVELVANALRRARADIRSTNRPIANFLFLGPTGVGKTELAKTIAEVYFGGEQRMIRIDMSEYQDKSSIYRLIGQAGQQGTGILTEAVRQNPFSLVLLDEMEKADPDVLNLFLQVFDDGRLTDSVGRVVDFTNSIIIATSNAGTAFVQEQFRAGVSQEEIREQLIRGELRQYYRPEFLNRFDGIILFKELERDEIKQVAALMLKRVAKDLETRGVELRVEDAALEWLASVGFDPDFGARPMRRAIQDKVENKLAELVLQNRLQRRDVLTLGAEGSLTVMTPQR